MGAEIHWMTGAELSEAFRARKLTPTQVTEHLLGRIKSSKKQLNCFCFLDPDLSLKQAEASARRWREGTPLSPLDGVPIAVKDQVLVKGWPTLRGSRAVNPAGPWDEDAPAVARVREAGMVLMGKTTTSEFGWRGSTDTLLCGTTRNPWNPTKTPGGSSGGSATAVSAGLVPVAIGTDGGGSVRIPAAFTGIFGLKPTFGRVPAYPASYMGLLAHTGPMARSARDVAMLMNIIAQPDPRDPDANCRPGDRFDARLEQGIRGIRFAFSATFGYIGKVDAEVEMKSRETFRQLSALGGVPINDDPVLSDPTPSFAAVFASGAAHFFDSLTPDQFSLLEPGLQAFVAECRKIALSDVMSAHAGRVRLNNEINGIFERADFLVTPSVATTAFDATRMMPIDQSGADWPMWSPYTFPFNLSGHPAVSVPIGLSSDGLPIGLQIVGKRHDDEGILRVARAIESSGLTIADHPKGWVD
jgi:aspartyl-tRNA(Asn)/glutamyl-tRNA(Gln) amidotransferase subunit A